MRETLRISSPLDHGYPAISRLGVIFWQPHTDRRALIEHEISSHILVFSSTFFALVISGNLVWCVANDACPEIASSDALPIQGRAVIWNRRWRFSGRYLGLGHPDLMLLPVKEFQRHSKSRVHGGVYRRDEHSPFTRFTAVELIGGPFITLGNQPN